MSSDNCRSRLSGNTLSDAQRNTQRSKHTHCARPGATPRGREPSACDDMETPRARIWANKQYLVCALFGIHSAAPFVLSLCCGAARAQRARVHSVLACWRAWMEDEALDLLTAALLSLPAHTPVRVSPACASARGVQCSRVLALARRGRCTRCTARRAMAERVRVPRLYTNCANDALTLWLSPGSRPARV